MTTLADAKLTALETATGNTGHVNDLEAEYLVSIGATAGKAIVDQWFEVFDAAAIAPGHFNDRFMAYMAVILALASSTELAQRNDREIIFWQNLGGAPAPQPPAFANVQHWFDFSDGAAVFSDQAGTVPAVLGGPIRHVVNKGTDGTPGTTTDPDPTTVTLEHGMVVNNLPVTIGRSLDSVHNLPLSTPAGGGAGGSAFALVVRANQPMVASRNIFSWGGMGGNILGNAGGPSPAPWQVSISGGAIISTAKTVIADEWVSIVVSKDGGTQDYFSRVSGTPELNSSPSAYSPVAAGGQPFPLFGSGNDEVELGELIVWDRALTLSERDAVEAYLDTKYGTLPFIPLPDTTDLVHHYDFTDNLTVFRNPAKTQLAGDGDDIRVITDKASYDPTDLTSTGGGDAAPKYRTGFINGENVADFGPSTLSQPLSGTAALGLASNTNGMSAVTIFRIDGGNPPAAITLAHWGSGAGQFRSGRDFGAGQYEHFHPGSNSTFSLVPIAQGGWYMFYSALDGGAGLDFWQNSGEVQQSGFVPLTFDIAALESIGFDHITSQNFFVAELAIWEGQLSATQIADLIAYAEAKYGTLPTAGLPPALPNLVHWVDPSDASTVWADALGTIPAVDGGTVLRIDNKGTDGTDLTGSFGSPTYRAGILNGENVIEFSGARLEATPIFGRTISTLGYTIAMVTRRQASHIGDSILWRWTPPVGNPGPSLRGKFSLNGNFHRADLLPDETLIADPSVNNQWYLMYMSNDASGATDDAKFGSPGPEVAGPFGNAVDIPNGSDVRFGTSSTQVQHGEAWIWDRPLTAAERAQLVAYVDQKYGTMPHL